MKLCQQLFYSAECVCHESSSDTVVQKPVHRVEKLSENRPHVSDLTCENPIQWETLIKSLSLLVSWL